MAIKCSWYFNSINFNFPCQFTFNFLLDFTILDTKTSYLCGNNKPLCGYTIILNSYSCIYSSTRISCFRNKILGVTVGPSHWHTAMQENASLIHYLDTYIENEQSFLLQKVIEYNARSMTICWYYIGHLW